ncbi:Uncharacterised protein [Mycobacteroides abscessus subsp. massiliense]|nr:Uncharacterised protein [Mycobacteroides abscessus subsp. massiliense]
MLRRGVSVQSCASRASRSGSGAMVPAAMAASCSLAPLSISTASEQDSSTEAPATTWPWWASSIAFLSPSAAEMISPSSFPTGTPGQSGRKAQSSYSGAISICDTTSGVSSMDSAATWNG